MNFNIINGSVEIDEKMRANLEVRLGLALGRFSKRIARTNVIIDDIVGPQEGMGKKCRIEVLLRPTRKIVAEDADVDLQVAVERTALQAARSVERKLRRDRELMN